MKEVGKVGSIMRFLESSNHPPQYRLAILDIIFRDRIVSEKMKLYIEQSLNTAARRLYKGDKYNARLLVDLMLRNMKDRYLGY